MIANVRIGSRIVSARVRSHSAPRDNPKMNADSINSNECVALPSTNESMRTHEIS